MNLQQLRSVREAVRRGFNLTEVARALHTSQPGVSRQIRELEQELGFELFVRAGKRLTSLTHAGSVAVPIIEGILGGAENLLRVGEEYSQQSAGKLSISATHSQARYALPDAVHDFRRRYPDVQLNLHQGSPQQVAEMLLSGEADIGIATEALTDYDGLVTLSCYRWTHSVIVPPNHPLLDDPELTLERVHIDEAFRVRGLEPNMVLTAMDADVIKTYVELGLGIGIIASIAFDEERDTRLRAIDAGHLFPVNVTRLAFRRGAFLRGYVYDFIETFASPLTREVVEQAALQMPGIDFQI